MKEDNTRQRILAVERFNNGENPESICTSLNKSRAWLYKWVSRYDGHNTAWSESRSRRPKSVAHYTPAATVEIIKMVLLNLYNQDLFCGAQAIHWEMEELGVYPLPSIRTINRILSRHSLTHRRTGKYEAKGTAYPALPSLRTNQTHQSDFVGPCYLKGYVRFYSLNVIDTARGRCGLYPVPQELQYEYVIATINIKEQKLKLFLERNPVCHSNIPPMTMLRDIGLRARKKHNTR